MPAKPDAPDTTIRPAEILRDTAEVLTAAEDPRAAGVAHAEAVLTSHETDEGVTFLTVNTEDLARWRELLTAFDETRRNHDTRFPQALALIEAARPFLTR